MSNSRAVLLMVLITLLWSTAGVVTRSLETAHSFEVNFWRSAITLITLSALLTLLEGKKFWINFLRPSKKIWVSGVCWSIMFSSFMVALTLTSVANVLIIMALSPLFTALFARFFLNHKLPLITWFAIVVAGIGIVWMFAHEHSTALSLVGSCVALTIPIAAAINFTILQSVGMHKKSVNISSDREYDMPHALILGATISTCTTLPFAWPLQASIHDIKLLSFLGVFQLALPCLLVIRVSKVLPAPEITLLTLLEVIFGVTWAWLWAGEVLSWNTILGGLMVVGALFVNEFTKIVGDQKKVLLT